MEKQCLQCGKIIHKPISESLRIWNSNRHKFCSKKCKNDFQKGKIPHDKGFKKGMIPWNKDKIGEYHLGEPTLEHRQKLSISKIGENNPSWKGGVSKLKTYPFDWNETLKISIRERDNYECQICGLHQDEIDINLHVHHIDYNKDNLNPKTLS